MRNVALTVGGEKRRHCTESSEEDGWQWWEDQSQDSGLYTNSSCIFKRKSLAASRREEKTTFDKRTLECNEFTVWQRLCLPPLPWAVVEGDVLHGVGRRRGRREGGAERPSGCGHGGRGTEGGALAEEGHGEGRLVALPLLEEGRICE